jgi:hydroxyethylthiazole kinase-like sugar kinase family protein
MDEARRNGRHRISRPGSFASAFLDALYTLEEQA